ncbi:MAG: methyltransferase domain-containing protein [Vulcanimicrobiaceae bacterium]
MSYLQRSCPNCSAHSIDAGRSVHADARAEDCTFDALRERWYGFFKEKSFFTYSRCTQCGMLYSPQYFTDEQLEMLYASMPANMVEVAHKALDQTQRGYFEHLRSRSDLRGQFLEIGPDVGVFAQYCVEAGNFTKTWFFEPNVNTHAELKSRMGAIETEISTSLFDLSCVPDGAITISAMIHVLDHITEPVPFLKQLLPKLAPTGKLLIVTHDENSLLAKVIGKRWPAYCLQHPHLFSPATIRNMLLGAGFRTVDTARSTNYFPLNFLAKQALLAVGVDSGDRLSKLPNFEIPLQLGNIITVAGL